MASYPSCPEALTHLSNHALPPCNFIITGALPQSRVITGSLGRPLVRAVSLIFFFAPGWATTYFMHQVAHLAVPRKPKRPHPFNHGCLVIGAFVIVITSPSSSPSSLLSSSTCGFSCSNCSSSPLVQPRVALISSPLALLVALWGCGTCCRICGRMRRARCGTCQADGVTMLPSPPTPCIRVFVHEISVACKTLLPFTNEKKAVCSSKAKSRWIYSMIVI